MSSPPLPSLPSPSPQATQMPTFVSPTIIQPTPVLASSSMAPIPTPTLSPADQQAVEKIYASRASKMAAKGKTLSSNGVSNPVISSGWLAPAALTPAFNMQPRRSSATPDLPSHISHAHPSRRASPVSTRLVAPANMLTTRSAQHSHGHGHSHGYGGSSKTPPPVGGPVGSGYAQAIQQQQLRDREREREEPETSRRSSLDSALLAVGGGTVWGGLPKASKKGGISRLWKKS